MVVVIQHRILLSAQPFVCFLSVCSSPQEIRQLQQKQAGFIREISDLQETIEWKDKKIGVGVSSLRKTVPGKGWAAQQMCFLQKLWFGRVFAWMCMRPSCDTR